MMPVRSRITGRWIGLTVLALVLVAAFGWLGQWQWGRTYRSTDGLVQEPAAVPLAVLDPGGRPPAAGLVGRLVTASGRYVVAAQRTVSGRELDGTQVLWVVTPLELQDGTSVAVVRGWVTRAEDALAVPPGGAVQVTGRLQSPDAAVAGVPGAATSAAYLVRTAQTPPDPLSLQPVPSSPPAAATAGGTRQFHLQNAIYTSQWWIFAVLVVVFWWRLLRDERTARTGRTARTVTG